MCSDLVSFELPLSDVYFLEGPAPLRKDLYSFGFLLSESSESSPTVSLVHLGRERHIPLSDVRDLIHAGA